MPNHFVVTVHLHDHRFHGVGDWPPAPARVFQALVAGAAVGASLSEHSARALRLLEQLPAPVIAAPIARQGQQLSLWVPNNDLDAVAGDPARIGKIRRMKSVVPILLEGEPCFLYAWRLLEHQGEELPSLASGLYQFGRGVDAAWARAEILDDAQLSERLRKHRGTIHRPSSGWAGAELAVPASGSLDSLVRRFDAGLVRLRPRADGKVTDFVQPPKAQFAKVRYDGTPTWHMLELKSVNDPASSSPWPSWRAPALVEHVRDLAVALLSSSLSEQRVDVERVVAGRTADGAHRGPSEERVRFVPLPSIGHEHADQSIRRVLVQVPAGPLAEADVMWALAGRVLHDPASGEESSTMLAAGAPDQMVARYSASARAWRSVTPLALGSVPHRASRSSDESKPGSARGSELVEVKRAVAQALRFAGVGARVLRVIAQREPFDAHGTRAERFAPGTRFAAEALWHVELELERPVSGPLVLGDGRFLGLGLMAPTTVCPIYAFEVEPKLPTDVDTTGLARALRRAVMARVQAVLGERSECDLPAFFHGHETDGEETRTTRSTHLAFSVDVRRSRLLLIPPHVLDGWEHLPGHSAKHLETLERALFGFTELRAGRNGVLGLHGGQLSSEDALLGRSREFRTVSDYVVTRHAKDCSLEELVSDDVRRECERRRLPRPDTVRVKSARGVPRVGVVASVELQFATAVEGPLLLGRTRFLGGGLFEPIRA